MDVLLDGRTQLALNSLLQLAFPALSMKEASPCSSYFLTQPRRLRPDSPFDLVICRSDPLPERYSRALASIQSAACFLLAIKNPPKAVWLFTLSALGGSYHIVAGVFLFAEGPTFLPLFGPDLGKLFSRSIRCLSMALPYGRFFLHPFQQIITEKTGCLCLADLRIAYKVDHLPADFFLQCPAHDVGMRVQGIGIVIANVDGFVVKEKCADDTFIRCFRKDVDLPSGREEVLVDMVTEAIVGTAFADDGLPVQIVIGQGRELRQRMRSVHPYTVMAEKRGSPSKRVSSSGPAVMAKLHCCDANAAIAWASVVSTTLRMIEG